MTKNILKPLLLLLLLNSCASTSRNSIQNNNDVNDVDNSRTEENEIPSGIKPLSLMELSRTEEGAFILAPGLYEADFKTFCLQPGTPDPAAGDAYFQAPVKGYRKEIVETILYNSRAKRQLDQKNVQLLLWSVVSGSNYSKLSPAVQSTATQLLSSKQIFELKGGVMGVVKTVSSQLSSSGLIKGNNDIQRLFETGTASYETFERVAVLREPSKVNRADIKPNQWYRQKENYYVRHIAASYKNVKIQVYVPDTGMDSSGKIAGEYIVFDPTGMQAVPANSNAQRLGIGGPVLDIIRAVIKTGKATEKPKKIPETKPGKTAQ